MASIVHILTKLELGGAQQTALALAAHQAAAGHRVAFVAGIEGALVPALRQMRGVEAVLLPELIHPISLWSDRVCVLRLAADLRARRPDIVHTHSSKAGILGREAARRAGVRGVVHTAYGWSFHQFQNPVAGALFRFLERRAARTTSRLVAVSDAVRNQGIEAAVGRPDQYTTILNAVDLGRFLSIRPARGTVPIREKLGLPDGAPIVAMIGNFKKQKAPEDFVAVAARVAGRAQGAHFVFVGDGVRRSEIEERAASSGFADRIHFVGWRGDVDEILAETSVVLQTSLWEGLPMSVLQAMAAARPVVATEVDGTKEAVSDGTTGFLCPPRDIAKLSDRVLSLLEDVGLARQMGEAGRARVRAMPGTDLGGMFAAYDAVYAGVAA